MSIYQFGMRGKQFAVDVESGNFFQTDTLSSRALDLLQGRPEEEALKQLAGEYSPEAAKKVMRSLGAFKKKGRLFACAGKKGSRIGRKITDLTLNIVNDCNLRCRYCWNRAGAYGSRSAPRKMGFHVAARAIGLLLKESRGAEDVVVDFYGGEPLLNFELIKETILYCRNIQKKRKVNFRFLLATNGTLLTDGRGEFLLANGVDIAVSLDGSRKVQDHQRPFPGGKGSFELIRRNIRALPQKSRRRIVGRATFTPYSTDAIKTFRFLRTFGFERIEVCESEKAGYGLEAGSRFFFSGAAGLGKLKSIYEELADFYTEEILRGNLTYENTYFNRFFKQLSRLYHIQSIVGACSAGFSLLAVDIDGSVYPCTAFVGIERFRVGSVENGVDEKKLKAFSRARISSSGSCGSCWARSICRGCGSCYNLNYFSNNDLKQPDPYYCELFRHKTKLMIAMIARISEKKPFLLDKVLVPEYYATRGRRKAAHA